MEVPDTKLANNSNNGIGIDLGLKDLAVVSNGEKYKNINKSATLKKMEKQMRREQRCLSRKYENLKKQRENEFNNQSLQSLLDYGKKMLDFLQQGIL